MEFYYLLLCCVLFTTVASFSTNESIALEAQNCNCVNGRCVTDNQGHTKCACKPGYALQDEFTCQPCDCGTLGKCIFILKMTKSTGQFEYQKKCVCDTGSAEKDGKCVDCFCGDNSACDFDYGDRRCYCIEGYSEKNGVCTRCDCGFYGKCEYRNNAKRCECDAGYSVLNGVCEECNCGANSWSCNYNNNQKTCSCVEGYVQKGETCQLGCSARNPCKNGGFCKGGFCFCQKGTRGEFCEVIDECVNNLCPVQGDIQCSYDVANQKAYCRCLDSKLRYNPDVKQCKRSCVDDNECLNGGKCGFKGNDKFCDCLPGTQGERCEIIDDCANGRVKCPGNGAYCSFDVNTRKATCKCSGSGLEYDSTSGRCRRSCYGNKVVCRHGGVCETLGDKTFCRCKKGTSGDLCDVVDDCAKGLCGYWAGVRCVYDTNREGGVCQCTNPDFLYDPQTKTCAACDCGPNSLSCKLNNGRKVCSCPDGFEDKNGICRKTRCVDKSCKNGRCTVTANEQEVCSCFEGYELVGSDYCRRLNCTKTPCSGGTCIVRRDGREDCVCPAGHSLHSGVCLRGDCSIFNCFGGACRTIEGELMCVCPKGYSLQGIGCFATVCKHQYCFGGVCHVGPDGVEEICICPEHHYLEGNVCKRILCNKPCFGGTCKKVNGGEVCECPSGYILHEGVCRANFLQ